MVNKVVLICGWQDELPTHFEGDIVGVDRGALLLARQGVHMLFAIGDFDSVDEEGKNRMRAFSDEIIALNPIKDVSDAEAAIDEAIRRGYTEIVLWGSLGGRFDHTLVNLKLAQRHTCLRLLDAQNEVYTLNEGEYEVVEDDKPYISFFALTESELSLVGFKYPLDKAIFTPDTTLGLSNQLTAKKARISVHEGKLLVIRSKDK